MSNTPANPPQGDERDRLEALYRVSRALGSSLNPEDVINQVMDAVIKLTGAERGFIILSDIDRVNFMPLEAHLRASRNFESSALNRMEMEVSRSVIQNVLENAQPVVTVNAQTDPRFEASQSVMFFALRSILCVPLTAYGKTIGVIYVDNRTKTGIFNESDLDLLSAFASQAAVSIENARIYTRTDQALSQRIIELEVLSDIDHELNARLDLERACQITQQWALRGTNGQAGWVILPEAESGGAEILVGTQQEGFDLEGLRPGITDAIDTCKAVRVLPGKDFRGGIIVPIIHMDHAIGVILVESEVPLAESQVTFLEMLANRAAFAIENARLYKAVASSSAEKSKFVSVVTHELRIPMTSIKGYTDLLRHGAVGPVNEQQISFLNVIRNNVDRMSALVSDLSDISHVDSGRMKLVIKATSLRLALDEALESVKSKVEEKGQALEVEVPAWLPDVQADSSRLVQVLVHLLTNANKYTPPKGKINVRALTQGDQVRVEITDTGIGISPKDQGMLFTQFFRSEDSAVREQLGWGLGLALCKRLVNLMGGEIGAQSVLKLGSTFWFTLPVQPGLK